MLRPKKGTDKASSRPCEAIRAANNRICATTVSFPAPEGLPPSSATSPSVATPAPVGAASDAADQRHRAKPIKTTSNRPVPLRSGSHRSRPSDATSNCPDRRRPRFSGEKSLLLRIGGFWAPSACVRKLLKTLLFGLGQGFRERGKKSFASRRATRPKKEGRKNAASLR